MENTFSFVGHAFMAAPEMDSFYVISTQDPASLPVILASFTLEGEGEENGISLELLENEDADVSLRISNGNVFGTVSDTDTVRAGRILVETRDSVVGNRISQLKAYFNGAQIDQRNRTLTAAGIGITDILSADPLEVTLVSAPLTQITTDKGLSRKVLGIYVQYIDFIETTYYGESASKIWGINIILEPEQGN